MGLSVWPFQTKVEHSYEHIIVHRFFFVDKKILIELCKRVSDLRVRIMNGTLPQIDIKRIFKGNWPCLMHRRHRNGIEIFDATQTRRLRFDYNYNKKRKNRQMWRASSAMKKCIIHEIVRNQICFQHRHRLWRKRKICTIDWYIGSGVSTHVTII